MVGSKSGGQARQNRFSVVRIGSPDRERPLGLGAHGSTLSLQCSLARGLLLPFATALRNSVRTSQCKCPNSGRRPYRTARHKGTAIYNEDIWDIMRLMPPIDNVLSRERLL